MQMRSCASWKDKYLVFDFQKLWVDVCVCLCVKYLTLETINFAEIFFVLSSSVKYSHF